MAIPFETVSRDRKGRDIGRIAAIAADLDVMEIVIGLPRHLSGVEGESARMARGFAKRVKTRLPQIRVCMVDERLSSGQAHSRLTDAGLGMRGQRSVVDQVAAQIILDQALEIERISGNAPGEEIMSGRAPEERN
jgi:RNAse H-fold protein YqgF